MVLTFDSVDEIRKCGVICIKHEKGSFIKISSACASGYQVRWCSVFSITKRNLDLFSILFFVIRLIRTVFFSCNSWSSGKMSTIEKSCQKETGITSLTKDTAA